MANSDKNLVITPNVGSGNGDPTITFSGADASLGAQSLQARIYPTSNGTLSFEGSAGQLFSITNSLTGTIYSVNDVSGLPSIEVLDSGVVRLARYNGRVIIGNITDNGTDTLQFGSGSSILFSSVNASSNVITSRLITSEIYTQTGAAATPTIYPDVTTGTVTIAGGLTTGTLNLASSTAGAKTVNIGTSTGTTVVWGSTVRLPNAGTPGAGKYLQSDASGNATWQTVVAGATITNDTTTNSDGYYPGMATATSGAWTAAYTSSTKLYFNPSTGQLNATNFNSLSDANKKENIKTIENATEKLMNLRGVTFNWKDNGKTSLGVIAQEVELVLPDVVSTSSSGEKSVNYSSLVGLLIEVIKEQNTRIEKLESLLLSK